MSQVRDPRHLPSVLFARLSAGVLLQGGDYGTGWSEGDLGAFLRTWWDVLGLRPQPDPCVAIIPDAAGEAECNDALAQDIDAAIAARESDGQPCWVERFGDLTSQTEDEVRAINRAREDEWAPVHAARFVEENGQ